MSRRNALSIACGVAAAVLLRHDTLEVDAAPAFTNAYVTQSGLKFVDFEEGKGPRPKWGDIIRIQYVAYTISPDGNSLVKEDSSYGRNRDEGFFIHHGNGEMVLGLEEALHSMAVGGRRRAIIPPDLAYNDIDLGPVPPAAWTRRKFSQHLSNGDGTVVFDIELLSVAPDPDDRGYYDDLTPDDDELVELADNAAREYADKLRELGLPPPDPDAPTSPYLAGDEEAYPYSPYVTPGLPRDNEKPEPGNIIMGR